MHTHLPILHVGCFHCTRVTCMYHLSCSFRAVASNIEWYDQKKNDNVTMLYPCEAQKLLTNFAILIFVTQIYTQLLQLFNTE